MRRTILPVLAVALLAAGCSTGSGTASSSRTPAAPAPATAPSSAAVSPSAPASRAGAVPAVDVAAEGERTRVRVQGREGGAPASTVLDGRWARPVVVPGSAPEGIAASGAVVLVGTAPAGRSRFAVLAPPYDAPRMVDLPGAFGYDAVSPDGRRLYLVEHLPPAGSEHYQVRSVDVASGALEAGVIVDKTHLDEWMAGHPVSRMTSADGATVATLYQRRGEAPFIHVLNTVDGFALCLDLPASAAGAAFALTAVDGTGLSVADAAGVPRFRADLGSGRLQDLTADCLDGVTRSALPTWARTGFSDDGAGLPHVFSARSRMIAALFQFPVRSAADPGEKNKILWIPAPSPENSAAPAGGSPGMRIRAELLGSDLRIVRDLIDGPGPSGVNFPRAGCWSLTLEWSGITDTLLLPVS